MNSGIYTDDTYKFHDIWKMRNKYATTQTFFTFVNSKFIRNWRQYYWPSDVYANW